MRICRLLIALFCVWNISRAQNVGIGTVNPLTKLDVSGALSLKESSTTLALSSGVNNNIGVGNWSVYRITGPAAAFSITGIQPATVSDGFVLTLINATTQTMTVVNEGLTSTASNRIRTQTGADVNIAANGAIELIYNGTTQRWHTTSGAGSGWSLVGNAGTSPLTNFIGTTDNQDWVIKTNNIERMRVTKTGNVGFGIDTPNVPVYVPGLHPNNLPAAPVQSVYMNQPYHMHHQGRYAYVTSPNYLYVVNFTEPWSPRVDSLNLPNNGWKVFVQGKYAYYNTFGDNNFRIVDISNPSAPVQVSVTNLNPPGILGGIYVQGNYAYVGCNTEVKIMDITNPAAPVQVGSFPVASRVEGIRVQGSYMYLVDYTAGVNHFKIADVSNPAAPVLAGQYTLSGNPADLVVEGRYAYVTNQGLQQLFILDISKPASITLKSTTFVGGGAAGFLYVNGRYAYVSSYGTNFFKIYNISNPNSPQYVGQVNTASPIFNIQVVGRYAYVTSQAANKLEIYDLGGAYIQELEAGGIEASNLTVRQSLRAFNDVDIRGGLTVGENTFISGNLGINGKMRLVDGTQALGRVLTSDANGNASWQPAAGGGGTLDNAYDFGGPGLGRIINADAGVVDLGGSGSDGLQVTGTFGSGLAIGAANAINSGAGTRMFFYPRKAAFRAGQVAGTTWNDASVGNHSVAFGLSTTASGQYSFAHGNGAAAVGQGCVSIGQFTTANGFYGVAIGSGSSTGAASTVGIAIGNNNISNGDNTLALGNNNSASGWGAQAIGVSNVASGSATKIFGHYATASHTGACILSDYYSWPGIPATLNSSAANEITMRFVGGYRFFTNAALTSGVLLPAGGGAWLTVSDVRKKENFQSENGDLVLQKLRKLNIGSWNYKSQAANIRHIGPTAQDFYAAFGFGESDTTITTTDIDGIALLSIQALEARTHQLQEVVAAKNAEIQQLKAALEKIKAENNSLNSAIPTLKAENAAILQRLEQIEARMGVTAKKQ